MYLAKISAFILIFFITSAPTISAAGKLTELFEKTSGAVVVLHTFEKVPTGSKTRRLMNAEGLGSGVLISSDGIILTAAHVVNVADSVHVEFKNGKKMLAKVISSVPNADIAMLQLPSMPEGQIFAPLADSDLVKVGDDVYIIGAPYGISHTLTKGYVSGRRSAEKMIGFSEGEFFQTDAAINQGNSGGPMFNMDGEVIGIVSYILSRSGGFEGLGFAVSSNTAKKLLMEKRHFWGGVDGKRLSGRIAELFNLPQTEGLLVERIAEGSPAEAAGLLPGDIVAEIDGEPYLLGGDVVLAVQGVSVAEEGWRDLFFEKIKDKKSDEKVTVTVFRKGKKILLSAPLQ